jgi:hypothetical protein
MYSKQFFYRNRKKKFFYQKNRVGLFLHPSQPQTSLTGGGGTTYGYGGGKKVALG